MLFLLFISLIPQVADQRMATLRGKVFAADTGAPLKHAYVMLRQNTPGTARDAADAFTAKTDSAGAYEFKNLEPGRYTASAGKPGFIVAPYRNQDNETGPLTVGAGQATPNVDFKLTRAVVVSGIVSSIDGEAVSGATVQATQKIYLQGHVEFQSHSTAQTDDRGEYRIHDLPPGRYYIQAAKRGFSGAGGGGPGYGLETYPEPVRLAAGEERKSVNFMLRDAVGYTVSGKVYDSETGQPMPNVFIYVNPENFMTGSNGNAQTRPDGSFRLTDLTPGPYRMGGNGVNTGPGPSAGAGRGQNRTFSRSFELGAGDITDMTIRIGPGAKVKGMVKAEGGFLPPKLQVSFGSRDSLGRTGNVFGGATTPEGTFEIQNIQPGTYEVSISSNNAGGTDAPLPVGSFFVSAVNGSSDVTFTLPDSATTAEVSATIDFRVGGIAGKTYEAGETADKIIPNSWVALISADPKKRLLDRYFRRTRSARDGAFKLNGVMPGDYFLLIWPGEDAGQVLDPEVFAMIEKQLVKATVDPNGKITQDLRLTPELRAIADAFAQ